jgi:FkbM family methyltransferase
VAVPRFAVRPGSIDADVYNLVVNLNEYALPERFDPSDTVIDVGAHIGTFSYAALDRGAGLVCAAEPDPENAALARQALAGYTDAGRFCLIEAAVSGDEDALLFHAGYPRMPGGKLNTAGGRVSADPRGQPVRSLAVDALIERALETGQAARIRLLKLDCEGAEWSILAGATRLAEVDEIVGELHTPADPSIAERLSEPPSLAAFADLLEAHGFAVRTHGPVNDDPEILGTFFARRAPS